MSNAKREFILCNCTDPEHLIMMTYWPSDEDPDPFIYISYHLDSNGLWRRLGHAIRHVFGYRSQYGDFGEVLLNREQARKALQFLYGFVADNSDCTIGLDDSVVWTSNASLKEVDSE